MNKKEFTIMMLKNNDTRESISKLLDIAKVTLSRKINENGTEFTRTEIEKLKDHWNLTAQDVDFIFFNSLVS